MRGSRSCSKRSSSWAVRQAESVGVPSARQCLSSERRGAARTSTLVTLLSVALLAWAVEAKARDVVSDPLEDRFVTGVAEVPSTVRVPRTLPEAALTTFGLVFECARGRRVLAGDPIGFSSWLDTALAEADGDQEFFDVQLARVEWFVSQSDVARACVALEEMTAVDPLDQTPDGVERLRCVLGPKFRLLAHRMPLIVVAVIRSGQDPRRLPRLCREALTRWNSSDSGADFRLRLAERFATAGVVSPAVLDGLPGNEAEVASARRLLAALSLQ